VNLLSRRQPECIDTHPLTLIVQNSKAMTTNDSTQDPSEEVTISQALDYAVKLHRTSQLEAAETLYSRILEAVPNHADAMHFLGVLRHQKGDSQSAIALIRSASRLAPNHADCLINLGNVLAETGELEQASDAYRKALELAPERADVFNNLGVVFKMQSRWEEAEECYQRAIELDPDTSNAYNNLGLLYAAKGQIKEAIHYYCRAVAMMPGNPDSRRLLGIAYYTLGKTVEAAEVFRQWVEAEPSNPTARHMYAACSGIDVPLRAADDYIEQTFDRFADCFEKQLQEKLAYRAPQLVTDSVIQALAPASSSLRILDAGCGTGLCGPLLRKYAATLVGVDLSSGMLGKAADKCCYDQLEKAELTAYMAECKQQFDVILSADTLVYFGPLDTVLTAARKALLPGGLLAFSVEQAEQFVPDVAFRINPHGRYAHSRAYLETVLQESAYSIKSITPAALRNEGGDSVQGWVVTAQCN